MSDFDFASVIVSRWEADGYEFLRLIGHHLDVSNHPALDHSFWICGQAGTSEHLVLTVCRQLATH